MKFILFLRFIRGFAALCLVVAAVAIVMQLLNNVFNFDFVMPSSMLIFILGLMHIVFWLWVFIGLRRIINWLHDKEFGRPHPSLEKPWHL